MKEHISYIREKLSNIPNFIDTTSQTHYLVWIAMMDINDEFMKIITPKFLSEKTIFNIVKRIELLLDSICEITARHITLKVIAYYSSLFLSLETYLIDNELFESCKNLSIFTNIYYQKSPI